MRGLTLLWSLLIAATLLSSTLAHAHLSSSGAVVIYAIALFKARCVILYMMDVRSAPTALRVIMEVWVAGMWITLSALSTVGEMA